MAMHKALIVERQPLTDLLISDELQELGFSCQSVPDNQTAMSLISGDRSWNLLVTDFQSTNAGLGGLELSRLARTLMSQIRVLFVSRADSFPGRLSRTEYFLPDSYEIEELESAIEALGFGAPQEAAKPARGEKLIGQQATGWRIDLSSRRATLGNVLLGYEIADEGRLQVTILAGGGDEEANCMIAGDAMAAIEAKLRNLPR